MPNLSVKLDDTTRRRLHDAATNQAITPHAFMVSAIHSELERVEAESAFIARALQARDTLIASGQAFDGPAFADYLRARVRGTAQQRPAAVDILTPDKDA